MLFVQERAWAVPEPATIVGAVVLVFTLIIAVELQPLVAVITAV